METNVLHMSVKKKRERGREGERERERKKNLAFLPALRTKHVSGPLKFKSIFPEGFFFPPSMLLASLVWVCNLFV